MCNQKISIMFTDVKELISVDLQWGVIFEGMMETVTDTGLIQ